MSPGRVRFRVIPSEHGMALRALLSRRLQRPQPEVVDLIKAGGVYVNKLRVRVASVRVATGERITVHPSAHRVPRIDPESLRFVHREPTFCVVDKPAMVPAEATKESCLGTISDALLRLLASEGVKRPYVGVVHALDPRASGLIMFTTRGLTDPNHHRLFTEHPIARTYRLVTTGGPEASLTVDRALASKRDGELRLPSPRESGTPASTAFEHLRAEEGQHLLEATLDRAPARQLSLHARAEGFPIVGDEADPDELRLCCVRMRFEHPLTGDPIDLHANPPDWAGAS